MPKRYPIVNIHARPIIILSSDHRFYLCAINYASNNATRSGIIERRIIIEKEMAANKISRRLFTVKESRGG